MTHYDNGKPDHMTWSELENIALLVNGCEVKSEEGWYHLVKLGGQWLQASGPHSTRRAARDEKYAAQCLWNTLSDFERQAAWRHVNDIYGWDDLDY